MKPATKMKRLLVIDGHGSHLTDDFMFECFKHDIYLLFLPPHASHVLQPLDLTVFSSLKASYRSELNNNTDLVGSSLMNKMTFLRCYHKAREVGLKKENILSGWKASGLWPTNVAKPLLNRMVLPEATIPSTVNKKREKQGEGLFTTPTHSHQVRGLISSLPRQQGTDQLERLLFRKVGKGLDNHISTIASAERKIKGLEQIIEDLRPRKRQKVTEEANSRFIRIEQIMAVRAHTIETLNPATAALLAQQTEFESLCSEWQLFE